MMMNRRLGFLMMAAVLAMPVPLTLTSSAAYADHGGYEDGGYDEGCGRGGGGCNNEREEDYEGAGCKYVCPSFDKSPVHDAFNFAPFICMPGATCYDNGDKGGQEQPPQEG